MLVVAGGDSAIMLDAIKEPLNPVAEFVGARAEGWGVEPMVERADIGIGAPVRDLGAQSIAVVAAIGEQNTVCTERAEHIFAGLAVVRLAFGQLERDREAVAVDDRVDFGRKPAAGTAHATAFAAFFSPLAAC